MNYFSGLARGRSQSRLELVFFCWSRSRRKLSRSRLRDLGLSQPEPLKKWRLLNTGFKKLFRHHELIMKGAKFEPRTGASASQQSALPMSLHISGVSICANVYPPLVLTYLKKAFYKKLHRKFTVWLQVVDCMSSMKKDNTGYDLKQLFIGMTFHWKTIIFPHLIFLFSPIDLIFVLHFTFNFFFSPNDRFIFSSDITFFFIFSTFLHLILLFSNLPFFYLNLHFSPFSFI